MNLIEQAHAILGYTFSNEALLQTALTHASRADSRLESNERMEFLGDAILGYICCEHLFATYPEQSEGDLTKIKSTVVSRKTCAEISLKIDLASMLNLGKGMAGRPNLPSSVSAAVFEAIVAAIYLDGGIEPTKAFVLEHLVPFIEEAERSSHQQNFKSVLQQHAQQNLPENPSYLLIDEKGPDHAKCFEVCVELQGQRYASAWANSKKEAEQKAALQALVALGLAEDETPEVDDEEAAAASEQ